MQWFLETFKDRIKQMCGLKALDEAKSWESPFRASDNKRYTWPSDYQQTQILKKDGLKISLNNNKDSDILTAFLWTV